MATRGARSRDKVDQIYKLNQMISLLAQSETLTLYAFSALPLKTLRELFSQATTIWLVLILKAFLFKGKVWNQMWYNNYQAQLYLQKAQRVF